MNISRILSRLQSKGAVNEEEYRELKRCKRSLDAWKKIKHEIIEEIEPAYADFKEYKVDYLGCDPETVEDDLPQDDFRYGLERAVEIINKHLVEVEKD